MKCPKCGAENPEGKSSCGNCGVSFRSYERRRAYQKEYRRRPSYIEKQKIRNRDWREKNRPKSRSYMAKYRGDRAKWFLGLKSELNCSMCGQSFADYPTVMEFHHKDGVSKEGRLSSMVTGNVAKNRILAEIRKCIPVCANCHRKLHADLRKRKKRKQRLDRIIDYF